MNEKIPSWKLRLQMIWAAISGKSFFFICYRKIDITRPKYLGIRAGEILPPNPIRRMTLEALRDLVDNILRNDYPEYYKDK